jgi:hypothetical protein
MTNKPDAIVFNPRGVVEAETLALAPRARELNGLRLGVLDNTKWNANRLLRKTVALLGEHASRRGSLLPKRKFLKGRRPGADRNDCGQQRHRVDCDRRLRLVHIVLYA